jgi:hypothetical protein
LSERSVFLATFALCGFANFMSIGIQIGGIGSLAPERRSDLAVLGVKALMGGMLLPPGSNVNSREEMLERANSPQALEMAEGLRGFMELCDTPEIAPSEGLEISTLEFNSVPDENKILIQFIRPKSEERLPCVYYIHGGGMQAMSCFDGNYRAWGKIIAAQGVAVAMVDFRNALTPSSAEEVAPYPAGLNDCVAGLKWLSGQAESLGIDASRIVVAGESGGGNLTLATGMRLKREGMLGLIQGLYALCPYIAGVWPLPQNPRGNLEFFVERLIQGLEYR